MKESSLKNSILLRMVLIAALVIALLIPIVLVQFIVADRQASHLSAVREVTQKWGGSQVLSGPVLSIPIRHIDAAGKDSPGSSAEILHILPENLRVVADVSPEIRMRGIHRVVLYTLRLAAEAEFRTQAATASLIEKHEILWDDAYLTVGITDPKGLRQITSVNVAGRNIRPQPGIAERERVAAAGFTVDSLMLAPQGTFQFAMRMELKGSENFKVAPVGKQTRLDMRGPWGDPSFIGDFLPEKRVVTEGSFEAAWQVLDFNRNLRQSWIGNGPDLLAPAFGVRLMLPVDEYQKNTRALKYAILFIALTFLAFLMIDVLTKTPFHPVHYCLVGFALILFYILLLSLSEYILFDTSYFIAGAAVVLLIGGYTRGVTRRWDLTALISSLLILLYAFLFILLQLEDYALLIGSIGLLIILAVVMYITRKIDWFTLGKSQGPGEG